MSHRAWLLLLLSSTVLSLGACGIDRRQDRREERRDDRKDPVSQVTPTAPASVPRA